MVPLRRFSYIQIAIILLLWRISGGFITPLKEKHYYCGTPIFCENPASSNSVSGITLKIAVDSQWGVSNREAEISERFTSDESLDLVHRLRRDSDAVLVGKRTVEDDDPSLTVRRVPSNGQPIRISLDSHLTLIPKFYKIFNDGLPTLIYHADTATEEEVNNYATNQTTCKGVPLSDDGLLDLRVIMEDVISKQKIKHLMVEGGPSLALSFLRNDLVDRVILIKAMNVKFRDPYPSNITTTTFSEHGLMLLGEFESGNGDIVQCWSRQNLPWPSKSLINWP